MNKVSALLEKPFSSLSYEEKIKVKGMGRPTPDLQISMELKSAKVSRVRKFNQNIYTKNKWICGCDVKNALFCFPCVLFGGDFNWTKKGVVDVGHIWEKMKSHEKSKVHINNVMNFAVLGNTNIRSQLDSQYQQTIAKHNAQVDKNRYVLNLIINCIRFCGKLELALRGHDESDYSNNKGVFRELIHFSAELDKELNAHLSTSAAFRGTSKTIQNDLLECMLEIYHSEVRQEISNADFLAIIADETTDASCQSQLVVILRYIVDGRPVERFWTFLVPQGHNAQTISQCILNEVEPLLGGNTNKLIAQSYDGASVMGGRNSGVQKIIRDKYPYANYIHCYAHQVNLVMSKAASINRQVRIFFSNLSGICAFFSNSPQRTQVLHEIVERRLPRPSQTRWNFQSRGVDIVFEYRSELIAVMEKIAESEEITSETSINQACSYRYFLNEPNFVFWLTFFHRIMAHVKIIFSQLQSRNIDPVKAKQSIENFEKCIQSVRQEVDDIVKEVDLKLESEPPTKRRKELCDKKREALEVCDTISLEVKSRFQFTGHLFASRLFDVQEFDAYQRNFPDTYLKQLIETYPFFEESRLKSELQVCYSRPELRSVTGAIPFLLFIQDEDLREAFQETIKLLKMLITMPMSSSEAERCFSTLKRIKTFLRNTMKEERLNALAMLSCEKVFVSKIPNFNQKVIELFAEKKDRKMEFKYRTS